MLAICIQFFDVLQLPSMAEILIYPRKEGHIQIRYCITGVGNIWHTFTYDCIACTSESLHSFQIESGTSNSNCWFNFNLPYKMIPAFIAIKVWIDFYFSFLWCFYFSILSATLFVWNVNCPVRSKSPAQNVHYFQLLDFVGDVWFLILSWQFIIFLFHSILIFY